MLSRRLLRIKVVKALFAHLKSGADNMIASEKNLMASVDKAYDLYFQILTLPVELTRYAEQRQELFNLRFQHTTAQLEKTSSIPAARKNIARILTVLKEKE